MRIGLDGIPLTKPKTGVGHYTFELARALALAAPSDDFQLVSPLPYTLPLSSLREQGAPANLQAIHAEVSGVSKHWWTVGLPSYLRQNPLALFHGSNYDVPLLGGCPTVLTIHDLASYLYPETLQTRSVRRARYRLPIMARRATMIVTPTRAVRLEVCERLNVKPEKVIAVHHAPRPCFRPLPANQTIETTTRLGIDDDFLLFVGTIEPRKNLLTLIRAFENVLKNTSLRPQLVIAGQEGWLTNELFDYVKTRDFGDRLRWTGYVSDEDLCALYSSCRAFIYPSIYEGFGLPPLEAMACGAPVISSRIPSITEVLGAAAHLVSPADVDALSQSIIELWENSDQRQRLSKAGQALAAEFSWERTARLTREVYRAALGSKSRLLHVSRAAEQLRVCLRKASLRVFDEQIPK
ncbi:MAG: glycosyltransferase family 4 protein [Acidobacteriota bacterium]|nr:glycosyltransferase family 4 protein [Acidobacteriota bacterium]